MTAPFVWADAKDGHQMIKLVQKNPDLTLPVVGHTDNVGTAAATLELSRKRADSVVKALIAKGSGRRGWTRRRRSVPAGCDEPHRSRAQELCAAKVDFRLVATGAWRWSSSREHGHCSKLEDEGGCR